MNVGLVVDADSFVALNGRAQSKQSARLEVHWQNSEPPMSSPSAALGLFGFVAGIVFQPSNFARTFEFLQVQGAAQRFSWFN